MAAPHFAHDCGECLFLDTIIAGGDLRIPSGDAYVCPQMGYPTIVVRYGNEGPEYVSGEYLVDRLPEDQQEVARDLMDKWSR